MSKNWEGSETAAMMPSVIVVYFFFLRTITDFHSNKKISKIGGQQFTIYIQQKLCCNRADM